MPKFTPPPIPPQAIVETDEGKNGQPTFSFKSWLERVQQWLSNSGAPKTSKSAGTPIQFQGFEQDGNFLYVCVGQNQWKRIPLQNF